MILKSYFLSSQVFFRVSLTYVPPLTVASFATITAGLPRISPTPVMIPADGNCCSYCPWEARGRAQKWCLGVNEKLYALACQ